MTTFVAALRRLAAASRVPSLVALCLLAALHSPLRAATPRVTPSTYATASTTGNITTVIAWVAAGGAPVVDGTVTFLDWNQPLATVQITAWNAADITPGSATLRLTLPPGDHNLVAQYNGDLHNFPSTSGPVSLSVTASAPSTALGVRADGNPGSYDLATTLFRPGTPPLAGVVNYQTQTTGTFLRSSTIFNSAFSNGLAQPIHYNYDRKQLKNGFSSPLTGAKTIAVADVNADGAPDILVNSGGTFVFLGNPSQPGQFTQGGVFGSSNATDLLVYDLNCDGLPDIVTSSPAGVSILFNVHQQPGQFDPQLDLPAIHPGFASGMAVGDVNGDGIPDILLGDSGSVDIYLGDPAHLGSFLPPTAVSLSAAASSSAESGLIRIAVGDFNHDGRLDIAAASAGSKTLTVLLSDATAPGSFSAPVTYPLPPAPTGIAAADLQGSGSLSLVLAFGVADLNQNPSSASGAYQIFGPDPATPGSFVASDPVTLAVSPYNVTTGDLNSDGLPDLVFGSAVAGSVSVALSDSQHPGQFLPLSSPYTDGLVSPAAVVADLNADGVADVAAVNFADNDWHRSGVSSVSVLLNNVTVGSTFSPPISLLQSGSQIPDGSTQSVVAVFGNNTSEPVALQTGAQALLTLNSHSVAQGDNLIITVTALPMSFGADDPFAPVPDGTPVRVLLSNGPGSVAIYDAYTANSVATVTAPTKGLAIGSYTAVGLVAPYSFDTPNVATTPSVGFNVAAAITPTATTLSASPTTGLTAGMTTTFTVNVSPSPGSNPLTSGVVTFYFDGGIDVGWASVAGGTATFQSPQLSPGYHSVVAVFSGNDTFGSSTSAPVYLPVY